MDVTRIASGRYRVTHCTNCNYESKNDFDVCPKCNHNGHAVQVMKPIL